LDGSLQAYHRIQKRAREMPPICGTDGDFFSAKSIHSAEQNVPSAIEPKMYKLCAAYLLRKKSFAELATALTQHFSPKPSVIVQRYKIHTCFGKPGEYVAMYRIVGNFGSH